ncbi:hypothetical protein FJZ31_25375 [Candidatus Poribacteria bacterium]|nr:hypothetical protein [Candidatus Poribacteria bacterium]
MKDTNLLARFEDKPITGRTRWHAIVIGLFLLVANSYWILMASEVWHSTQLTIATLFFNAVFTLLVLVIINSVIRRIAPRFALSQADLFTIYTMIVMLTTISGHTMMGYLLPAIEHPFWFASPENEWEQLFGTYLPKWLTVHDRDVLAGYFQGESSFYIGRNLRAWLPPMLSWSLFIIVLWTVLMLLSVVLRKQWMENERLSYPIVQLPLAMATEPAKFFKNGWMWAGFAIVGIIDIWNGIGFIFPSVPMLQVKNHFVGQFSTRPWNAMGGIYISFYPFVIGLMFFTPLDLSFSCWFFYIVGMLQHVFASAVGWQDIYFYEQSIGAWIAFGLIPIWLGRKYFWQILRKIVIVGARRQEGKTARRQEGKGARLKLANTLDDSTEPVPYRLAVFGIFVGMIILAFFWMQAGMSLWVILLYFILYFPMVLGITRSRAEIGTPEHTLIYVDPGRTLVTTLGTRRLGPVNLAMFTLLYPLNRCYRANPMPSQLEGFRIAERAGIDNRQIMFGMLLAIVVGVLATFWIYLHVLYQMGAAGKARGWIVYMGWETYNRLQSWLVHPRTPNYSEMSGICGGFLFTIILMIMKSRFLWWPLHPGGYVLTTGAGLGRSWFAVFISWVLKAIILKYGGAKLYRKAAPFFFGLILGDYTLGCIWSLIGIALQVPTYGVWH